MEQINKDIKRQRSLDKIEKTNYVPKKIKLIGILTRFDKFDNIYIDFPCEECELIMCRCGVSNVRPQLEKVRNIDTLINQKWDNIDMSLWTMNEEKPDDLTTEIKTPLMSKGIKIKPSKYQKCTNFGKSCKIDDLIGSTVEFNISIKEYQYRNDKTLTCGYTYYLNTMSVK